MSDMKGTPCISGGHTNMMTEEDSDLIHRSDALGCFHDWVDRYGDVHTPDEMPEYRAIEALPSVEPKRTNERTETCACDLVSRQAVTDTVRKIILGFFSDEDGVMTDTEKTLLSVNKAICNGVRELPSAQPERTDCTECPEYDHERHYCQKYCDVIRKTLEEAKPEPQWIPCKERLPEEYGNYLATMDDGDVQECTYSPEKNTPFMRGGWSTCEADGIVYLDIAEVVAWMPLPEPYKEGEGC